MEYVFGTSGGYETVMTKGEAHTHWVGFKQIERDYGTESIVDNFHVVDKEWTAEDSAGNCYDRYLIDQHYRIIDKSPRLEQQINTAKADLLQPLSIAFVTMAEAGSIDATTAAEHADFFAEWNSNGVSYNVGQIVRYNGKLYKCLQQHTSQETWTPEAAVSQWKQIADPAEEWPEWSQPVGAHDCYGKGDKVSHGGKHWTSDCDANVWEPGVYGWTEA